ncbi:MAG: carotenoid 1,2-hydratase [Polyangiaceae bacterium]
MSDDGRFAVVIIAMLGNVFSPYYAAARARGRGVADPLDFVTMNVALYGPSSRAWALTERRGAVRDRDALAIGPSSIRHTSDGILVEVDEVTAPLASRIAGTVRLEPEVVCGLPRELDAKKAHRWWPISPRARVTVDFPEPGVRWSGHGYFDANAGDEPLEDAFSSWSWSRLPTSQGAIVSYDVRRRDGSTKTLDVSFDARRGAQPLSDLTDHDLGQTRWWRLDRRVRAPRDGAPRLVRTLEDTPFYSRSAVEMSLRGTRGVAVHESLSLERFGSRWVRTLLPMRIRRVTA